MGQSGESSESIRNGKVLAAVIRNLTHFSLIKLLASIKWKILANDMVLSSSGCSIQDALTNLTNSTHNKSDMRDILHHNGGGGAGAPTATDIQEQKNGNV